MVGLDKDRSRGGKGWVEGGNGCISVAVVHTVMLSPFSWCDTL